MKETIKNLKKVYEYGREYKKSLIIQTICCLFGIFVNIVIPLISAKFIVNFTNNVFDQAVYMLLVVLSLYLLENLKTLIIRKNTQIFRRGTVKNIQLALGGEILKLEQETLDSNTSGAFARRLGTDTDNLSGMFTDGMGKLTRFISNIGSLIAVLIIDYHMFIYYLTSSFILTILFYIKNEKVGKKDIELRKQSDKVAGLSSELVRGARDIKMLYAKDSFLKTLDKNITLQSNKNFEMRNTDINYNIFIHSIRNVLEFFSVIYIMYLIKNNVLTVAVGLALYNYRNSVLTNFMDNVSELFEKCKGFNISANRVFSIIDGVKFKKESFGTKHIDSVDGNFEFKNVSFGYTDKKVLNDLSFKIENGTTIGFVGKSGSGKTTIFNLLCKMYKVDSGNIYIDGNDISELDEESIRGNITIINQSPYIFNMSIKDNLRLVKNNLTTKEMKEACKLACLDDYIESLPNKYNTIIGEGGVNLSGGQKQRLAIARALVQNTKIILFDEATSALDNETQTKIQEAIDNLKGKYTIMIIAHRLSTIVNCDKIYMIDNGKVIEYGTHKELLKRSSDYKKLYEMEINDV